MVIIGICDDQQNMRNNLRKVLELKLQLMGLDYLIKEYGSGEALLADRDFDRLELLFLDIEMKGMSGMDTAKALRKNGSKAMIIFVTAYPDFVFQGYEVHAFHYILKPYEEKKIIQVLEQGLEKLTSDDRQFYIIKQKSGVYRIPFDNITAFCSDRRIIKVLTVDTPNDITSINENDGIHFYGKLAEVEQELPGYFIRIHNRWLVNLNFVTAVEKDTCICSEMSLPVSRTYKQALEIAFARILLG
ncbi:MAG: response regulator transcription factor [Clostridiales bacterium]|nr:response regulator transcription factor [Clostridiales bacterium]